MAKKIHSETILPSAPDIEAAVLGAILLDGRYFEDAKNILQAEDSFYDLRHRTVFSAMESLASENMAIDLLTVIQRLREQEQIEIVPEYFLAELTTKVTTTANLKYHCHIVLEKALQRKMYQWANECGSLSISPDEDILDVISDYRQRLDELMQLHTRGESQHISIVVDSASALFEKLTSKQDAAGILKTGLADIDRITGGGLPSNLIVLGGSRKAGKTSLALKILFHNARLGKPMGYFSREMSSEELCLREALIEARIDFIHAINHGLSTEEKERLAAIYKALKPLPIYVNRQVRSVSEMRLEAGRLHRLHKIQGLVVDYMQLVLPVLQKREMSREQEVASISAGMKNLAVDLNIVVFALTQLNKQQTSRESGAIENDADKFIYLDAHEDDEIPEGQLGKEVDVKIVQRFGPSGGFGSAKLYFDIQLGEFRNAASECRGAIPSKEELLF
jgi:replicative DNA helicase